MLVPLNIQCYGGEDMGLLDQLGGSLKGAISSVAAAEAPALISAALAKTNMATCKVSWVNFSKVAWATRSNHGLAMAQTYK